MTDTTTRPDAIGRRHFLSAVGGSIAALAAGAACAGADGTAEGSDAAAAADTAVPPPPAARVPGLQLYTVRSEMQRDFDGTLARVAEIGYREVEFAGYFERLPAQVRASLQAVGLAAPAAHIALDAFAGELDRTLDSAAEMGHRYVIVAWVGDERRSADGYRRTADEFNGFGEAARTRGLVFGYHNHDFEFAAVGDTNGYDILLENTDPQNVGFEMDLFWITKAGHDPLAYFERWPGRFPAVHVKDMDGSPEQRMVDVGAGTIDFASIFARSEQAGIRHYFVEHDNPADPMESIRQSHLALAGLLNG
jgi:sugar phosphate isomerase/epimerase